MNFGGFGVSVRGESGGRGRGVIETEGLRKGDLSCWSKGVSAEGESWEWVGNGGVVVGGF